MNQEQLKRMMFSDTSNLGGAEAWTGRGQRGQQALELAIEGLMTVCHTLADADGKLLAVRLSGEDAVEVILTGLSRALGGVISLEVE